MVVVSQVPCATNSDCHSRCPSAHPLHGTPYTCQKNFHLYDYFETTEDGNYFRQMENGDRFDPDPRESAITGEWGVCVVRLQKIRTVNPHILCKLFAWKLRLL